MKFITKLKITIAALVMVTPLGYMLINLWNSSLRFVPALQLYFFLLSVLIFVAMVPMMLLLLSKAAKELAESDFKKYSNDSTTI